MKPLKVRERLVESREGSFLFWNLPGFLSLMDCCIGEWVPPALQLPGRNNPPFLCYCLVGGPRPAFCLCVLTKEGGAQIKTEAAFCLGVKKKNKKKSTPHSKSSSPASLKGSQPSSQINED